jgi:hypothetical protein
MTHRHMSEKACQQERGDWTQYWQGECESDSKGIPAKRHILSNLSDPPTPCRKSWSTIPFVQLEKEGHSAVMDNNSYLIDSFFGQIVAMHVRILIKVK